MTIYARSEHVPSHAHALIAGKLYRVTPRCSESFYITNEDGRMILCLWHECDHLNGGNWEKVDINLEQMFDMTDTSDVPDAAIEAVAKAHGWDGTVDDARRGAPFLGFSRLIIAFARLIAREHPEWIEDPDLAAAREIYAVALEQESLPSWAARARAGKYDHTPAFRATLAAFKAGRAAERAGR